MQKKVAVEEVSVLLHLKHAPLARKNQKWNLHHPPGVLLQEEALETAEQDLLKAAVVVEAQKEVEAVRLPLQEEAQGQQLHAKQPRRRVPSLRVQAQGLALLAAVELLVELTLPEEVLAVTEAVDHVRDN